LFFVARKKIKSLFRGDIRVAVWEKQRLIYVRVPKSGNSSICKSIEGCDFRRMDGLALLAARDEWTTFSFVRNPWARLVSAYTHKATPESSSPRMVDGVYQGFVQKGIPVRANMPFAEFCEIVCDLADHKTDKHLASQSSFLIRNDVPVVSFIGKIENMRLDWQKLMQLVELDIAPLHLNRTSHSPYRDYFTDSALINLVGDRYADDIRHFNYEF